VKAKAIVQSKFFKSALGAVLAVLCGLMLWKMPLGEPWVNASYDYLFRFGARAVTNRVTLILMDNEAFDQFHQTRGQPWDRGLHAQLLNRLADDGCALVVFDSFFRQPHNPAQDEALADAMRRQQHIVLMAEQSQITHPTLAGAQPILPTEPFLSAAGTNWGVAWLDPDLDSIVRRHWPFPSPGPYASLPWTAAQLTGARVSKAPQERWLRYYGTDGAWIRLSYGFALAQPTNYFRGQIVFIGTEPKTSVPDSETDKFRTPYSRWTGESSGGVEILVTSFLNLVNHDWLRRPAWGLEVLILVSSGVLLGGGLCRLRLLLACAIAVGVALIVAFAAICWSYFTNFWFPWLVIAGGQVPCALSWALAMCIIRALEEKKVSVSLSFPRLAAAVKEDPPDVPDYELFNPPFGGGAYGKVWLARNKGGQWRALKVVYLANFEENTGPYEREFNGIKKYQPISDKHPGLLRVEFVSKKQAGYFYYVMELGDPLKPGWEQEPSTYKPRDLVGERARSRGRRLPVRECVRIGLALTDALDFIHRHGLTHRDIKPQNVIFVNGQPKLADLGLITEIKPPDQERTLVGTPGYMPPAPERPGTPQADIYALGMVLYVLSTGRSAAYFPEIATTLVETENPADFLPLNTVVLKACQPDPAHRYVSAAEMHCALQEARKALATE
jgi:CHASE2 domain-containing sensor protein